MFSSIRHLFFGKIVKKAPKPITFLDQDMSEGFMTMESRDLPPVETHSSAQRMPMRHKDIESSNLDADK